VKRLAVAADNPDVINAVTTGDQLFWTDDAGANWRQASLPMKLRDGAILQADRVSDQTFYLFDKKAGRLVTTNGGRAWSVRATPEQLPAATFRQVAADPNHAGLLLACWGTPERGGGVARSSDGGATWQTIRSLEQGWVGAIGKAEFDGGPSTLFVRGIRSNQTGIWRSPDDGQSWQKIVDHPLGIHHQGGSLWADWEQFGVVYITLRGNGFAYGQPIDNKPSTE
jgi:photosystem II stability/assembly factor-like uncharacterized protein